MVIMEVAALELMKEAMRRADGNQSIPRDSWGFPSPPSANGLNAC
jgi:hypothetical protein